MLTNNINNQYGNHAWSMSDMVKNGTCNKEIAQNIAKWIDAGMSILVVGSTNTGKTSFLNAMSDLFPPDTRIQAVEDSLNEFTIKPWKYASTIIEPDSNKLRESLKYALLCMPNIIVMNESRGAIAYDLMDAANTGHQVFSSLHANSPDSAVNRLMYIAEAVNDVDNDTALGMISAAFDIIIHVGFDSKHRRRVLNISEVRPDCTYIDSAFTRPLWKFEKDDSGSTGWVKINDISAVRAGRTRLASARDFSWEDCVKLAACPPDISGSFDYMGAEA